MAVCIDLIWLIEMSFYKQCNFNICLKLLFSVTNEVLNIEDAVSHLL